MRPLVLLGIVLIVGGGYVLIRGLTYTSETTALKIGDLEATVKEKKAVPTWVGVVALAGGAALIISGLRKNDGAA